MNLALATKLFLLALPGAVESATFFKQSLSPHPSGDVNAAGASPPAATLHPHDEGGPLSQQCLEDNYGILEVDPAYNAALDAAVQTCHETAPIMFTGEDEMLAVIEFGLCDFSGLEDFCETHPDYYAFRGPYREHAACGGFPVFTDPSAPPDVVRTTQVRYHLVGCWPASCDLSGGYTEEMLVQLSEYEGGENCTAHFFEGPAAAPTPAPTSAPKSGKASKGSKSKGGKGSKRQ